MNIFIILIFLIGLIVFIMNFYKSRESFENDGLTKTVNLPINTTVECENKCSPLQRCYLTGEQCSSDIDCYGCNPSKKNMNNLSLKTQEIKGENEAGKLGSSVTPTYSVLTTDIGTRAKTIDSIAIVPAYNQGVNLWSKPFNTGKELYDKRYNPSIDQLKFMPNYPERKSLSGEFIETGALAANS